MKLTRDSVVLSLAALGAALAYLIADGRPPTEWNYSDWLKAAMAGVMWLSGKASSSWLKGAEPKA